MSLNIKNPGADRLVEDLSRLTGESKTRAVIEALRERLAADLLAIGRRCAAHGRKDDRDHGELLYDERGLPG